MPDSTTATAQVPNTCTSAGKRPNKTSIFISGVNDIHAFQACSRVLCPCGLMAQLQSEKLMVVPSTAKGFSAVANALRSLGGREGVSFQTYSLTEDGCVRLFMKKLGKRMP
jgi:hypothetical protein